ncbi:MAG: signal peptidase II [Defluviitaleaceae bacterium]|nr:signal peptidase II [Defluviitaleaceae bacterium]
MTVAIITAFAFFIDQISKTLVRKHIPEKTRIEIARDKFYLTNVKNTGAAYGVLKNNRKTLMSLTILSFIMLVAMFKRTLNKDIGSKVGFSLIFGGALGNFYDRTRKKYVTDFLFIKFKNAPIFNLADVFIAIGNILLILRSFKKR